MHTKKLSNDAGTWHHFLMQELQKKQMGENYHEPFVMAALRHLRRYGSSDAFDYYYGLYIGLNRL